MKNTTINLRVGPITKDLLGMLGKRTNVKLENFICSVRYREEGAEKIIRYKK